MPVICRLLALNPETANLLVSEQASLENAIESAKESSDVYRYWDGIQYLLSKHRPGQAAEWLSLGTPVSSPEGEIPASRILKSEVVGLLHALLVPIEPDELSPHYDAANMDQAGIYPECWERWEETFDPLGQLLEHFWFLKQFASQCVERDQAMLLHFTFLDDGSDGFEDNEE